MRNRYGEHVDLVRTDDVVRISVNRPDRLNAFVGTMRGDLRDALRDTAEGDARVVLLTGAGRAFSAGADLAALLRLLEATDVEGFGELVRAGTSVIRTLRSMPQVSIAAINGIAAGAGASLAAACDLRIASESARIGFTFVRIGLHPDWGATHTLPRLVGHGRAAELLLTGRILEAGEAAKIGLVDRVVAEPMLEEAVAEWSRELASQGAAAAGEIKASLNGAASEQLERDLDGELQAQLRRFRDPVVIERVREFLSARSGTSD